MDELAERGGAEYYEEFPELSEEFLANAKRVDYPPEQKELIAIEVAPSAAAYIRSHEPTLRQHLSAMIEAHIAKVAQDETPVS